MATRLRHGGVWAAAIVACLVFGALLAEFAPLGLLTTDAPAQTAPPQEPAAEAPPPEPATDPAPDPEATEQTAPPESLVTTPPPETVALAPIVPTGEPIPIDQLTLGVDGIGELAIGDPALPILGRLAATLGPPDEDLLLISDGTFSGCPGEEVRVVRWGTLALSAVGEDGSRVFAGYRVDLGFGDDPSRPGLATISGLRVGDTVADLRRVYTTLSLEFFDGTDGPVYELRRPSDGALLLTGPLSGVDDASVVEGIYSPDLCL